MRNFLKSLIITIISLIPLSLQGVPKRVSDHRALIDYASNNIRERARRPEIVQHLKDLFVLYGLGAEVLLEEFKELLSSADCSIQNVEYKMDCDRFFIDFLCRDTLLTLIFENARAEAGRSVWFSIAMPSAQRLIRLTGQNYGAFFRHLYELLNTHIRTCQNPDPFAIEKRDAFEAFGHNVFHTQVVECSKLPPFEINAKAAHMFVQKWWLSGCKRGQDGRSMEAKVKPLCGLLIRGAKFLCPRVKELFRPTVIIIAKVKGGLFWRMQFPKFPEGEDCRILAIQRYEENGKRIFVVTAEYMGLLPFAIKFTQDGILDCREIVIPDDD